MEFASIKERFDTGTPVDRALMFDGDGEAAFMLCGKCRVESE